MNFERGWRAVGATLRPLAEFVFPPACPACGAAMERAGLICNTCRPGMLRADPDDPAYTRTRERVCGDGMVGAFLSAYWFDRDGPVQDLLHRLKYEGMGQIGAALGREAAELLRTRLAEAKADGVVPVPLHRARQRERGYNQSLLIAQGVASALSLPVLHPVLRRVRNTPSQTTLSHDERRKNVAGAFTLDPSCRIPLGGLTLLLVDDVATTGATLAACAQVLRARGVAGVLALTVAQAR